MLSLKPTKPSASSTQPDLEAVRRQVSAQQALSREVSEPAVIVAASDDQSKRPMPDDGNTGNPPGPQDDPSSTLTVPQQNPSSTPQSADGVVMLPEETTGAAAGIVKQPSSMAKRFGFLTSLRRGSTAAEGSIALSAQMTDTPQDPPQDPPEQREGAITALPDQSGPVPAEEPASGSLQGASLGVHQGSTLGDDRAVHGASLGVQQGSTLGANRAVQASPELVSAAAIELPPVFEYGSEGEEAQVTSVWG